MKKTLALITGTDNTLVTLKEQLENYIGDILSIKAFATDEGINETINADLVIISTSLIYEEAIKHVGKTSKVIIGRRVLNYSKIEKILSIPYKEDVLFVNDCMETAYDCIECFEKLGLNHINYIPFYPGCKLSKKVKYAITPGEKNIVPKGIENVIDIGPRLIDMTTIAEILKEFNLLDDKWESISSKYMSKIIELAKKLALISNEMTKAYNHIVSVMDGVRDGILAIDNEGIITAFNENLKCLLGIRHGNIIGKNIRQIINDFNLREFILNGKEDTSKIIKIKESEFVLTKFSLKEDRITVITFKSVKDTIELEKKYRYELYSRGYYAKYTFDDIVGVSKEINNIKDIAKKLSLSDLSILIEGESGTGKELFASAVHNYSARKNKPFVAVNFSSLPESLVESELFGYEEGAFTGALKGGKMGFFEQANGGTIFLDEIGDVSLKVQSRLLRVLQEKEVMRIGGNRIIPIDVRVIAATNQNLTELVKKGLFRMDLYHRLKVLYINIPPLRKRPEDVIALIKYFLCERGLEDIEIDDEVLKKLCSMQWTGNVRELRNTIDYIIAVCDKKNICINDLPQDSFFNGLEAVEDKEYSDIEVRGDYKFILENIYEVMKKGQRATRLSLSKSAKEKGFNLTEQMIRNRLDELEKLGLISKTKGKGGTTLTCLGIEKVKQML
ncbi:Transcriptional regulator containing PAS, AAA-type ATPase, and DNA-binding Fis domains [Caloramator quimbayensis]|uniref:Transcriptional regulator containing PAS, AAA-type ATPase, and DNA-binding Fis domains n=1 Tax=Caloramator quimbayensis TaxID=1147123 RepID=A0A1T4X1Z6_9CLOT|nr:sigma 54-interacting transcriptional regulator [Caloramator quimbayensis]SKA83673.1 Transcriptional regulator containing PAS, AAA-type ATPase, and DNA-binding Fis domains [Caloramator quimbayensis]